MLLGVGLPEVESLLKVKSKVSHYIDFYHYKAALTFSSPIRLVISALHLPLEDRSSPLILGRPTGGSMPTVLCSHPSCSEVLTLSTSALTALLEGACSGSLEELRQWQDLWPHQ